MGPQGDRMDLLQQLAHLDDDLGRKLCSRMLAVTHGHNHVGSPDSHSASSRQEEAFARLLHLLSVMLTANHASSNTKAKEVSLTIIKNCERFQLMEWEALYVFHQEAAQARNAALAKQSLAMPASTMQVQDGTPPPPYLSQKHANSAQRPRTKQTPRTKLPRSHLGSRGLCAAQKNMLLSTSRVKQPRHSRPLDTWLPK